MNSFFITGTDTGIGKTLACVALLHLFRQQGLKVVGMKPVASGCDVSAEGLRNGDALALRMASSFTPPYEQINPYAFAPAIAPHLAAESVGVNIDFNVIVQQYRELTAQADAVVVEGVGGWRVPLNAHQDVADLATVLGLPVILVVGLRLGCINHARLTAGEIHRSGLELVGWIANHVDPHSQAQERNMRSIQQRLSSPLLGVLPWDERGRPGFVDEGCVLDTLRRVK